MTGNVRKLAMDFGYLGFWSLAVSVTLLADIAFLQRPEFAGTLGSGILLALQGTFSAPKVPLWRTLPVTDGDIGRARWWQLIGIPCLVILALMALAIGLRVLAADMGGDKHLALPDALELLAGLLGQCFYPVSLTVFLLAATIARTVRSPLVVIAIVATGILFLALFPLPDFLPHLSLETRALWFGSASVLVAAILYATAPVWPHPFTQPLLFDLGGGDSRVATSGPSGRGGWTGLARMALLRPAMFLAGLFAFWAVMIFGLNMRHLVAMQISQLIPFVVASQIGNFNSMNMRLLRCLPGSTLHLTVYLFFLPLAALAFANCASSLVLLPWLTGGPPRIDTVALLFTSLIGALVLPAVLHVTQVRMSLFVYLPLMLVPLIEAVWRIVPRPGWDEWLLAGVTSIAICAGFFWMHAHIRRSMRIYRFQPYIAARWRGAD